MGNELSFAGGRLTSGMKAVQQTGINMLFPVVQDGQPLLHRIGKNGSVRIKVGDTVTINVGKRKAPEPAVIVGIHPADDSGDVTLQVAWLYLPYQIPNKEIRASFPDLPEYNNALFLCPEATQIVSSGTVAALLPATVHVLYDKDVHTHCIKGMYSLEHNALIPFPFQNISSFAKQIVNCQLQTHTTLELDIISKRFQKGLVALLKRQLGGKEKEGNSSRKFTHHLPNSLLDIMSLGCDLCSQVRRSGDELFVFIETAKHMDALFGLKELRFEHRSGRVVVELPMVLKYYATDGFDISLQLGHMHGHNFHGGELWHTVNHQFPWQSCKLDKPHVERPKKQRRLADDDEG